jgi:hypothetical protein
MVTKEEFEKMWNESKQKIKYVCFDFGWIKATKYRIDINDFVILEYNGKEIGYVVLEQVYKVD